MTVVSCKFVDAESDINGLVDGLRRGTYEPYASICHNVGQSLVRVSEHMKEMLDHEVMELQQSVHDAICRAARSVQRSIAGALRLWIKV